MERAEILLAEYEEGGLSCRAQEQYVRTTLNMFLTLAAAVAGFIAAGAAMPAAKTIVCFAAFGVGSCMLLLVLRHRKIYGVHAERLREIEAELQMALHTQAKSKLSQLGDPTAKTLSAFIIGIVTVGFLVAAIVFAFRV